MEAKSGHTDDMYHSHDWSRTNESASFPCCVVVRRVPLPRDWSTILVFPRYAVDKSRIDVEEVDPNFVMATLICFPETQRAARDGEGSMRTDLPFIFGTRWI